VLAAALVVALVRPSLSVASLAVWVWVLWPLSRPASARRLDSTVGWSTSGVHLPLVPVRPYAIPVRYLGGHPLLPRPGRGLLRVWQVDGAAVLRVGRREVAFPLAAVRSVTLVEGRVGLRTGFGRVGAHLLGSLLALGRGRFCGVRLVGREAVAIVDRSRVVCEVEREEHVCRLVLTGPAGGGEEIYLETLVALRPSAVRPQKAADGGGPGAAAWPPHS